MSKRDSMSEEYVADLLKKDAKDSSVKYSAMGLEAFLPKRPTVNAPKPNTRFLQNIIRETNNHNAALKAKEVEEAASRLKKLKGETSKDSRRDRHDENHDSRRKRKRQWVEEESRSPADRHRRRRRCSPESPRVLDESDDERHRPRRSRRREDSEDSLSDTSYRQKRHRRRRERRTKDRGRSRSKSLSRERHKSRKKRSDDHARDCDAEAKTPKRRTHHHIRSHSPGFDLEKAFNKARRHRSRRKDRASKSPSPHKPRPRRRDSPDVSRQTGDSPIPDRRSSDSRAHQQASDSDPLESLLGPALPPSSPPAPKPRGRGAHSSRSGIDSRFAASYDPSTDVRANSGSEDDWEGALEAMRDRQRWRQQGAERLRAAGFGEKEVEKWAEGRREKGEEDVRWKGRWESRDWDRGKMIEEDGSVVTGAEWGRLKAT